MVRHRAAASGFTLIEVLIAMGLFVVIAIGIAQLSATATRAARTTRERTMAVILAAGKLDELRALDWTYEHRWPATRLARAPISSPTSVDLISPGTGRVSRRLRRAR